MSPAMRRPASRSLIQRRTSASRAVTLRWVERRNLRVVSSANRHPEVPGQRRGTVRTASARSLSSDGECAGQRRSTRRGVTGCKTVPCDWPTWPIPVVSADGDGPAAAHGCAGARQLTDLLTGPGGTGETARDTGDDQRGLCLVSETRRNAGDVEDACRMAHNPESRVHQIPPPLLVCAGQGPFPVGRGPFARRELQYHV